MLIVRLTSQFHESLCCKGAGSSHRRAIRPKVIACAPEIFLLVAIPLDFNGGRNDRRSGGSVAPFFAWRWGARQRTDLSASERGLDWFTFFLADIQTGFGPFVAVYLTAHAWAQFDIGLVLTAGGLVALAGQMPGGALVERGTLGTAPGHACGWRDLRERARASDRPLPLW